MYIITMILAFFLAFQAGQMKAMIDINKVDGIKSEWKLYFFLICNSLISIYMIISLYGAGITRGIQ